MTFTLRPLVAEDSALLASITEASWRKHFLGTFLTEPQFIYDLQRGYSDEVFEDYLSQPNVRGWGAYTDTPDALLGYITLVFPEVQGNSDTVLLDKLYLHPGYNNQGLARLLVDQAKHQASLASPAGQLMLYVNRENPSVGFYQHLGFTIDGEIDDAIGYGFIRNDYRMSCPLT